MKRYAATILMAVSLVLATSAFTSPHQHAIAQAPPPAPSPQPPPAPPLDAKAVITLFNGASVPETWKQGFSLPLSASRSIAGSKERSVVWKVDPPEYDQFSVRRDNGRSIDVQTGVDPVTLVITLSVAKGDTFDQTEVRVRVGNSNPSPTPTPPPGPAPTPTPTPGPTPTPQPAPSDLFGKLGYDYGAALMQSYADTLDESASMLAAGVSRKAIVADFDKRWKPRREKAFNVPAAEFAKIVPDDREPNGDEKGRLADAWRGMAKGVRGR